MKKLATILFLALFVAATVVSCGPSKPPCPAYGQADTEQIDENV